MTHDEHDECANDAALYVLGALPPEKARAVEQRLGSGCPYCTQQTQHYAIVAEQLSLAAPPVTPPPGLRQRVLDRIQTATATATPEPPARHIVRANESPWIQMPHPGVAVRPLAGQKTVLLRLQPGGVFPSHYHPQAEQCYVLEGTVMDSSGLTLHAGDFIVEPRGIQHEPISSTTGCTLLITYAD